MDTIDAPDFFVAGEHDPEVVLRQVWSKFQQKFEVGGGGKLHVEATTAIEPAVALGGLEDGQHGPVPGVAGVGEERGRAREPGDVHVVPAGVHDRDLVAVGVGRRRRAGIRQAGRLADRQRVHVGAQHHRGTVTVAQHADDAGAPHARGDVVPGVA